MRTICTRVIPLQNIQEEYEKLLQNTDIVFLQVEVYCNSQLNYVHLKGGHGREPKILMDTLVRIFHTIHRFEIRRLDYFYDDRRMRSIEVVKAV